MPDASNIPYFVCTLGEAQDQSIEQPFLNVNQLIEVQARKCGKLPAIGFYRTGNNNGTTFFDYDVLTFQQLQKAVVVAAKTLLDTLSFPKAGTVGLLSSSSPEFLLTWLACIWLGHPVLLLAPQCSPTGILHLCEDTGAAVLLFDENNSDLANKAAKCDCRGSNPRLSLLPIPFEVRQVFKHSQTSEGAGLNSAETESADIAYFHHTSGTSSGVPKPIPQSHRGAVGALPALDGTANATFTTTPLYHGGPADIFRAWASGAMIWIFPSHEVSITASNIVHCLESAYEAERRNVSSSISYFASVPYVLQMMTEDGKGLKWLRQMDLVGVGGAALPAKTGAELVNDGVNLVSRFGSAECGFLLSSHRSYGADKEWQYLRHSENASQVTFEPRDDGLAELVVMPSWPHLAKRNRDDGSFATSDLFERHPHITNAWKYHSRADAQLTLVTGKKFDPEPIESAIAAASVDVSDVLIFGNDKPYAGALLFRSPESAFMSDQEVVDVIIPAVSKLNGESESHARISSSMLLPMPYHERPLPKSSKGTVLRKSAEEMYAEHIENAYQTVEQVYQRTCADNEIPEAVSDIVREVLAVNHHIFEDAEFFALGVDSIAAMRIRHKLRALLPENSRRLPISIVEDAGSIGRLSKYLIAMRNGHDLNGDYFIESSPLDFMRRLVDEYSTFNKPPSAAVDAQTPDRERVVLTGATGALGAHVLNQLRANPRISKIYCLVRGADSYAARERVNKALNQRQLLPLDASGDTAKVVVLQAALGIRKLGLSDEIYAELAREATIILHSAWSVNFRMKLQSFVKDSIASVQNLINLALATKRSTCPRFLFCSSVASAMAFTGSIVPEDVLDDPSTATNLGYSQSKWVAEHVCKRASELPSLCGRVAIFRIGQLSGDSETGVWNKKEAWPLMLSSFKLTGSLPDLGDEPLDWVPVDVAAAATIEGALTKTPCDETGLIVYHLLNDSASTTWSDLLQWARKRSKFETVQPEQWIRRLEQVETSSKCESGHQALQLLDHWKVAYRDAQVMAEKYAKPEFSTIASRGALPSMSGVVAVDEEYFAKLWDWIDANM